MDEAILLRYLQGKCKDDEVEQIELWYEESSENRKKLEQLYYILSVGKSIETMKAAGTEEALKKLKSAVKKPIHRKQRWFTVAAAFIAGLILSGAILGTLLSNEKTSYMVTTNPGQRAQATLPDGSKVWLNASTNLTYRKTLFPTRRLVCLSGEAYFEVAHNKRSPFIVNAQNIRTTVIGTKFNLRARREENKVVATLLDGSIKIISPETISSKNKINGSEVDMTESKIEEKSPKRSQNEYLLKPGQTLNINTETYIAQWMDYSQPEEVLIWMNGKLSFDQQTLLEITEIMTRVYDIEFEFKDDTLKGERFTGEFSTDDSPGNILTILQYTNHFVFKQEGRKIVLSKK